MGCMIEENGGVRRLRRVVGGFGVGGGTSGGSGRGEDIVVGEIKKVVNAKAVWS